MAFIGKKCLLDCDLFESPRDDKVLSLARCPNPKCDKEPPIRRLAQLKNILTLAIRRHVKKFYSGVLICEDPACEGACDVDTPAIGVCINVTSLLALYYVPIGRTRQLPLRFNSGYPECSTCHKAAMVKEYTDRQLYTQMLFYQQLFDVAKASSRHGINFASNLSGVRQMYNKEKETTAFRF